MATHECSYLFLWIYIREHISNSLWVHVKYKSHTYKHTQIKASSLCDAIVKDKSLFFGVKKSVAYYLPPNGIEKYKNNNNINNNKQTIYRYWSFSFAACVLWICSCSTNIRIYSLQYCVYMHCMQARSFIIVVMKYRG